jgi:molybdenum cofactor synthesis domain-containing protein
MSEAIKEPQLRVGIISISDRASQGVTSWLSEALLTPFDTSARLIADERQLITDTIIELVDEQRCHLVLTTGGTGPSRRDVTPEATRLAGTREMPGFGEQMRQISLRFVPTAILSRQTAVVREIDGHAALVINLPGQPKSIRETLEGLKDAAGNSIVPGIFAAVPYCLDLIDAPYIETNPNVLAAFRPKSARRATPL